MCINSNVTARLKNYYISVGHTDILVFAPKERKDILITFDKRLVYFGFSLNGHGFDFQRSEDHDNLGNRAFIILQNIGNGINNFIPREVTTSVNWIAVMID